MKRTVIFLLITFLVTVGCARTVPVVEPNFTVASKSQAQTGEAINEALKNRRWVLVKDAPGRKVAKYSRSNHSATVEIRYTKDNVAIKLLESNDLAHGYNKRGEEVIHKAYANWMKNLERDIGVQVSYR